MERVQLYLKKNYKWILVFLFFLFMMCSYYLYDKMSVKKEVEDIVMQVPSPKVEKQSLWVDIKGAVVSPGVYQMETGQKVADAIEASGGMREDADVTYINLSKKLVDEMVIIIYTKSEITSMVEGNRTIRYIDKTCVCPSIQNDGCIGDNKVSNEKPKEDAKDSQGQSKEPQEESGPINLNTAPLSALQKLTGIGEAKANAIIEYRKKKPFTKPEDLKNVKGIGDAIFAKIKDHITV